jgi:hypothetical protein
MYRLFADIGGGYSVGGCMLVVCSKTVPMDEGGLYEIEKLLQGQ